MSRPNKYWLAYRAKVYGSEQLGQVQERETSLGFYAGMFAAFNQMAEIAGTALDEESGAAAMEVFRREILQASAKANLDRSTGQS